MPSCTRYATVGKGAVDSVMHCGAPAFIQARKARPEVRERRRRATAPKSQSYVFELPWHVALLTCPDTADDYCRQLFMMRIVALQVDDDDAPLHCICSVIYDVRNCVVMPCDLCNLLCCCFCLFCMSIRGLCSKLPAYWNWQSCFFCLVYVITL